MYILGISAYYHDSAAALVCDGDIVSASQEERFTRKKHDAGFPENAIRNCLREANIQFKDIDHIIFYDKPLLKFERLLETYVSFAPKGFKSFLTAMPVWLKEKLYLKSILKKEFTALSDLKEKELPELMFNLHHQSHAASAFFPSPFQEAAVMCLDGVGEWATTSVWYGKDNKLEPLWEIKFPHSLGLLYSAFTYFTGFKVNSGEYKLMGLAPYGDPKYVDLIIENLIDLKEDGTFRLRMEHFDFATGLRMTNDRFAKLFGRPARKAEAEITQMEMDIAASIQKVTEIIVLRLANTVHKETGCEYLCLAGGVALNCVSNGKLLREGPFKDIWIQPAAGDAGGALGAALTGWYEYHDKPRQVKGNGQDMMKGSYLGQQYDNADVQTALESAGAKFEYLDDDTLFNQLADILDQGKVVGWFQGKMEFGPRALGGRSIIGDPRNSQMQSVMNLKIKYRESFRPFAPAILADKVSEVFDLDRPSPYMLIVSDVKDEHRIAMSEQQQALFGIDRLKIPRSKVPAITHVDYSARIQTVHAETNPKFYKLLEKFDEKTGCPVLVNTSFNVRGEPIVCTPEDAYRCFMRTEMDYLVVENYIMSKTDQPEWGKDDSWQDEFELD